MVKYREIFIGNEPVKGESPPRYPHYVKTLLVRRKKFMEGRYAGYRDDGVIPHPCTTYGVETMEYYVEGDVETSWMKEVLTRGALLFYQSWVARWWT